MYDLVVIGGGPAGYTAALLAAKNGMKTAVVEKHALGGTCLNVGCIPTKAILHSAKSFYDAKNSFTGLGINIDGLKYDMKNIYENKTSIVDKLNQGVAYLMKKDKVATYYGVAKIIDNQTISIMQNDNGDAVDIKAKYIIVATGAKPILPKIDGVENKGVMTSDEILHYDKPINSIAIIGGGVIGCEFASIYSYLGCKVTILEYAQKILPTMDKELSQNLSMILKKRGVDIITSAKVTKIESLNSSLNCIYEFKENECIVNADIVLVCVGRKPNIAGLFDDGLNIALNNNAIKINDKFQTSIENIYAIGDVTGGIQLAHVAYAQAEYAIFNILDKTPRIDLNTVPSCVYTEPEIACVGLDADTAKANGFDIAIGKYIMSSNGKSIIDGQERGFIKIIVDKSTDKILGAQLMCGRASDLIGEIALAISNGLTYDSILKTIHPHPTYVEGIYEAVNSI